MNADRRRIAGVIALLVLIGLLLPSHARVERQQIIDAYPATVFSLLNDFRRVAEWAPYTRDDPNARFEIGGSQTGEGATVTWSGRIIGSGRETISESLPFERIVVDVDLGDGRETTRTYALERQDGQTIVTVSWQRETGLNPLARAFALFQDGIRGPDFERDLASLAEFAGILPRADFGDLEMRRMVVETQDIAYITTRSLPEASAMSAAMSDSFFDIYDFMDRHSLSRDGAPMSITRTFSGSELVFDAAIPVRGLTSATPRTENAVKMGRTYAGPLIRVRHKGDYGSLAETHRKIAAYLAATATERNGDAWESYVSDPELADESGLETYLYYPVRN
jgi:effector-binding domain-containing protein